MNFDLANNSFIVTSSERPSGEPTRDFLVLESNPYVGRAILDAEFQDESCNDTGLAADSTLPNVYELAFEFSCPDLNWM